MLGLTACLDQDLYRLGILYDEDECECEDEHEDEPQHEDEPKAAEGQNEHDDGLATRDDIDPACDWDLISLTPSPTTSPSPSLPDLEAEAWEMISPGGHLIVSDGS